MLASWLTSPLRSAQLSSAHDSQLATRNSRVHSSSIESLRTRLGAFVKSLSCCSNARPRSRFEPDDFVRVFRAAVPTSANRRAQFVAKLAPLPHVGRLTRLAGLKAPLAELFGSRLASRESRLAASSLADTHWRNASSSRLTLPF